MSLPSAKTRRLILISLLAGAAALFAVAVLIHRSNPGSASLPTAIQDIAPAAGSNVLSQTDVLVDLAVGYTAEIRINGFTIPETQLFRVEGLNSLRYEPRPGKIIEGLRADQNCVDVEYWLIAQGPETAQTYSWCFDAS